MGQSDAFDFSSSCDGKPARGVCVHSMWSLILPGMGSEVTKAMR